MGKHRKSKKNIVQVSPDSTFNYISGILTGANNYITGLLEGANMYNAWVTEEMTLEGTEIGEYKPDSLNQFLKELKATNNDEYIRFVTDPYSFLESIKKTNPANYSIFINKIKSTTNYGRLYNTDVAMIKAGKAYREQTPSLIKSKNIQSGLSLLQNYAPSSTQVIDKINGILTSGIKVE